MVKRIIKLLIADKEGRNVNRDPYAAKPCAFEFEPGRYGQPERLYFRRSA